MQSINGAWFDLTPHSVQRALDMTLDADVIRETLGNPRHVRPGKAGREMWTRGKVTAVMEPKDGFWLVVTFVWATANAWATDRETVQSREYVPSAERDRAFRYAAKMRKRGGRTR